MSLTMYWTKNGSIPSQETDGTEGWQQAPAPPTEIPDGHELYWEGREWVIIPPKPEPLAGHEWAFYKVQGWVPLKATLDPSEPTLIMESFATEQIANLTTAQL